MLKLILSLIIAAHAELSAQNSQKQLYIIGGAGDPDTRVDTIFDPAFKTILEFLPNSDWQATVRYDGNHSKTVNMLQDKKEIIPDQDSLSAGSFNKALDKMKNQAETLPPGAQMLVYIDSHAPEKAAGSKMLTHEIAVSGGGTNLNLLTGAKFAKLDGLQEIISAANARGVKIAIVDLSCHSGSTQTLANDKTCVISSTASNLYASKQFIENFTKNMTKGQNLESIYLATRKETGDASLPMISTPAGKTLSNQEQSLTGFLIFKKNTEIDKMSPFLSNEAKNCTNHDLPLARLNQLNKNLSFLFKDLPSGNQDPDFVELKNLVESYQKIQSRIEQQLNGISTNLSKVETIEVKFRNEKGNIETLSDHFERRNLVQADWTEEERSLRARAKDESGSAKFDDLARAALNHRCAQRKAELLAQYPEFTSAEKAKTKLIDGIKDSVQIAKKISAAERKVYQKLYEKESKKSSSNACKDFVL